MATMKWKRQTPEVENGDYWFNGKCFATRGVMAELSTEEVRAIAMDVSETSLKMGGIDYLQVYENQETGLVIWVIDQVTKTSLNESEHPIEHNYFTILLPCEY